MISQKLRPSSSMISGVGEGETVIVGEADGVLTAELPAVDVFRRNMEHIVFLTLSGAEFLHIN